MRTHRGSGGGFMGNRAVRAPGAARAPGSSLGSRPAAGRGDARTPGERRLPAGRHAAERAVRHVCARRGAQSCRHRRVGGAVTWMPGGAPRGGTAPAGRCDDGERHEGAGDGYASAPFGSDRGRGRAGASGGGALGTELRRGSCAPAADGRRRGVVGREGGRPRPDGVPRPVLPPVRQRRRGRRRDWRRAQERHRDCRWCRGGAGAWPERARGAHYAWAG